MNFFKLPKIFRIAMISMLILAFAFMLPCIQIRGLEASKPDVTVTITNFRDKSSQMATGAVLVDSNLSGGNANAAANAKRYLGASTTYVKQFIKGWGANDPWPDPTQPGPTNWGALDTQIRLIKQVGSTPIIALCGAPWWMEGQLQSDGTTELIPDENGDWGSHTYTSSITDYRGLVYPAGYVSPDPYASRVLDNQLHNWVKLVQAVAQRYMAAPYKVRRFEVWNELKGYHNPAQNIFDYTISAGDSSRYNAKHGYTYLYNQTYNALKQSAQNSGISPKTVLVGGPYVVMDSWSNKSAEDSPSNISGPYGNLDQRDLDIVSYWLQNKIGGEFLALDGAAGNKDNVWNTNEFTAGQKFADIDNWVHTQPGGATIPIEWSEWYASSPQSNISLEHYNAIIASDMMYTLTSGAAVLLIWGPDGNRQGFSFPEGIWTAVDDGNGGQTTPFYFTQKYFHDKFGPGTQLYTTKFSKNTISVLASDHNVMLVNHLATQQIVAVNDAQVTLSPYQVTVIANPNSSHW